MKPNIAIYLDVQNVRISPEKIKLLNLWLTAQGDIVIKKAYADWSKENRTYAQALHKAVFKTIHNPYGQKNAVDNEMMGDCKHDIMSDRSIRIVILITGDKDFLPLVKKLQQLGIKVILISGANVSQALKKIVDEAYDIDKLIASVNLDKAIQEKIDSSAMIPYEEAKKYLIELIKTVQAKGKKATLALMGSLIKKHPRLSGDKKVLSIGKPDGKYFSKFSKFVEAVIKEGIIQNRNGELILVEI